MVRRKGLFSILGAQHKGSEYGSGLSNSIAPQDYLKKFDGIGVHG